MLIRSRWRLIINTLSHQNPSKVAAAAAMATTTTTSSDSNSNPPPKTITFGPYEVTSQVFFYFFIFSLLFPLPREAFISHRH